MPARSSSPITWPARKTRFPGYVLSAHYFVYLKFLKTEQLHFHFSLSCIGEGNGNPLQYSCLENPRDGGAWWAAVYGVAQSRTRLKQLNSSSSSSSSSSRDLQHQYFSTGKSLFFTCNPEIFILIRICKLLLKLLVLKS